MDLVVVLCYKKCIYKKCNIRKPILDYIHTALSRPEYER